MTVEKRRWGGWWMVLPRLVFVLCLWLPVPLGIGFAVQLLSFANTLPQVPDITMLRPAYPSRVETVDGWWLGGASTTEPVPYEQLPPHVVAAFLAAEDEDFFVHQAFSLRGILRAAMENWRLGRSAQGASTITQQVARQFLTSEKTYERKVKELLVARRMESTYSKSQILAAYLGSVFLGHTAHGVTQAASLYFGKSPLDLDVAEAALLAGILPAPSRFSPYVSTDHARAQRARVLRRLHEIGYLTEEEATRWSEAPIELAAKTDVEHQRMPRAYYAGLRIANGLGKEAWGAGGLRIVVPHEPVPQALARKALRDGIIALDRRQGWRGPLGKAHGGVAVDAVLEKQPVGRYQLGRVAEVGRERAFVVTRDGAYPMALEATRWAEPAETPRHYKRPVELGDLRTILAVDDIVLVERIGDTVALFQMPAYEGAILDVETATGRVRAAVGGFDADLDEYDRAFQGCRQPGSVFKPVVYAEALSRRMTAATMLSDSPTEVATGRGGVWSPRNADRDFKGFVTLANALAWSRNIPTVNLMDRLGPRQVVARAKKLGVTESRLDTTSSVALGASCVRPYEMAQVYGAFQRRGRALRVASTAYWIDDHGAVRDDVVHFAVRDWRTSARMDRMVRVEPLPDRALSENVSYIMLDLLRRVVTSGTAHDLPDDWLVAGKTGTTNDYDAWFVGFDGRATVSAWIGSDENTRPLGRGEHGATAALPVFQNYVAPFVRVADDDEDVWLPPAPPGIEMVSVDTATGLRTPEGEWGVEYPFVVGTAPREVAPTRGTKQGQRVDELLYDF